MTSAYQTSSHYSVTQSHPAAPSVQERPNLPSLKDLNFTYNSPQSQDGPPPQSGPGQSEHAPPPPAHSARHDTASWGRAAPSGSQPPSHHGQAMPPPPQKPSKSSKQQAYRTEGYARLEQASHKPNGAWAPPTQGYTPQPPQPVAGGSQSSAAQQAPLKHGRTESTVSASPGRSPHQPQYSPYASQQHAPSQLYQVQGGGAPQPEAIQQPSPFAQANAGPYQYSTPQHLQRGAYAAQPPPPPQQQPQQQHQQQHQQARQSQQQASQQQQQQHQQAPPPQPQRQQPPPQQRQQPPPQQRQQPPPQQQRQQQAHPQQPHQQQQQQQPPPPQQQQQQVAPGNPYHQPPPQHWQSPPAVPVTAQQQPPPQTQMQTFVRTTPIVPANLDPRTAPPPPPPAQPQNPAPPPEDRAARQTIIDEIAKHCNTLWGFANKYASAQPQVQPHPNELRDMSHFATQVLRLLEELKRFTLAEEQAAREAIAPPPAEETRPPKRPWEDMARDDQAPAESDAHYGEEAGQSTAEQDMEIIRSKRATSSTGATPGQPKSKYRKRSRATPPGKCHSCNIRETPEWRRGPDGARTLCNACGLHYAKLMRKRDKQLGADGKPIPIDLQTLRMSTLASKEHGKGHHQDSGRQSVPGQPSMDEQAQSASPSGSYEPQKPPMQQPPHMSHGSPYQLPSVPNQGAPPPTPSPHQLMHPPPIQPQQSMASPSQSPWMASPPTGRGYQPSSEPPAYLRPQHNSATHTRSPAQ